MAGRPPGDRANGKKRLLDACWELLVEVPQGERLTISSVCERANCTPPTLYHHFGDLASLERAASRRAFLEWNEHIESTCAHIADPRKRLVERARIYLTWAQAHPDAYAALFCLPRRAEDPNTVAMESAGFDALLQDLSEVHDTHPSDEALRPLAYAYWTGVHGLASLANTVPDFFHNVQESTLGVMIDSLALHGPVEAQLPIRHITGVPQSSLAS